MPSIRQGSINAWRADGYFNSVPSTLDNLIQGYDVGSTWTDLSTGILYLCTQSDTQSATWIKAREAQSEHVMTGVDPDTYPKAYLSTSQSSTESSANNVIRFERFY